MSSTSTSSTSSKKSMPSAPAPAPPVTKEVEKAVSVDDEQSEYEEIDLTENPLYQVLSAFFENERGENLVDHVAKLTAAVESNTKMLEQVLKKASK